MITINGIILDASGTPVQGATIHFLSLNTPLAGAGKIIVNSDIAVITAADGSFHTPLEPGGYQVQIVSGDKTSLFQIAVPDGTGSATLDTLITTSLAYVYLPPGSVWNGTWPGANCRVMAGLGLQIFNNDTALWHTLTISGNPPQLGFDAGTT